MAKIEGQDNDFESSEEEETRGALDLGVSKVREKKDWQRDQKTVQEAK